MASFLRSLHAGLACGVFALPVLAQPTISSVSPAPNHRATPRSSPVTATFSQPLNQGSIGALHVFSSQRGGRRTGITGTTSLNGAALSFTPSYQWMPGETIRASVTTAAQNSSGQSLATPYTFEFRAAVTGSGLGAFAAGPTCTTGAYPTRICLADVNGDDRLDMLTSNANYYGGSSASVRFNDGTGQFAGGSEVAVATGMYGAYDMTVGDLDGDGDLDMVTTNQLNEVSIRGNNGAGAFRVGTNITLAVGGNITAISLADIDGDADLDLLVSTFNNTTTYSGALHVRLNNGNATFTAGPSISMPSGIFPRRIKTADVDNDGDVDVVVGGDGGIKTFLNDGAGRFTGTLSLSLNAFVSDCELGDLDGDGDIDLLAIDGNGFGSVSVCLNNGAGNFQPLSTIALFGNPKSITMGDLDGDGDLDFVVSSGASVSMHFNNGNGAFPGYYRLSGTRLDLTALGDVDGDGDLDLVSEVWPPSPPSPPCPVNVYLNQPTRPVLSTNHRREAQASLYPNPAQSTLTLALTPSGDEAQLSVLNSLGQTLLTQPLPAGSSSAEINVAALAPGMYSLWIKTKAGSYFKRFVKA